MKSRMLIAAATLVFASALTTTSTEAHFYRGCITNKCKWHVVKPYNDHLMRIAKCESDFHWHDDSQFDGGLQFTPDTWNQTGSKFATADLAGVLEQKYRAVIWASIIGWAWHTSAGWPVCG